LVVGAGVGSAALEMFATARAAMRRINRFMYALAEFSA